ncbi:MAG: YqjK-like family protein [Burkholderiales bacterium]|jgi:hypothetical protein|nr:YqjK-like family protein [Burkholderiales bacterium]
MNELNELIARREKLLAQSAAQRAVLAQCIEPWSPRLAWVDRGIAAVRYVRRYPAALAGMGLLVAALRPLRAAGWLQRGFLLWQVGSTLRNTLRSRR